jgi:multiple sugar transport system substrate-binding protein
MEMERYSLSRRTLLRGAGLAGLGALTAGCGSPFVSAVAGIGPPKNTLSYWNLLSGGDGVRMIAMEGAYQQAHPNVALDAVVLAWGNPYYTKLSLATLGSRPPDVAISHLTRAYPRPRRPARAAEPQRARPVRAHRR